jgi:hypothetical protein
MERAVVGIVVSVVLGLDPCSALAQSAFAAAGVVESTAGGFRFPDGTVQLTAAEGGPLQNVIRVSPSGGDFTSVEDALASIVSPSYTNRFLVLVGPGIYYENGLLLVPGYVHLRGAGPKHTLITSDRNASSLSPDAAAVQLATHGWISDLRIRNAGGTSSYAVGVYMSSTTRSAVLDNVVVEVDAFGGVGHYGLYLSDAEPTVSRSTVLANGASAANAAIGVLNVSGPLPRPLIVQSLLNGGNGSHSDCAGNLGSGIGIQGLEASPEIVDSVVCGSFRSMAVYTSGAVRARGSVLRVGNAAGAFLVEASGSADIRIATSGVFHAGSVKTGAGTITCTQSYKSDYGDASSTCG